MTQKVVMDPTHPKWDEFCDRLEGTEGCNYRNSADGETTWDCAGGEDKTFAEKILKDIGNIDIAETFALFEQHGGYCDCEILMNVAESFEEEAKLPAKIDRKTFKREQKEAGEEISPKRGTATTRCTL
jgi:hypothetical protein